MKKFVHVIAESLSLMSFRFIAHLLCRRERDINIGSNLLVIGRPVLMLQKHSRLRIGTDCILRSMKFSNPLGIKHPIIFATMSNSAEIVIGNHVGLSGGSICAAKSVNIGDGTLIGANCTIVDTDFHPIHPEHRRQNDQFHCASAGITIGKNVFIGTSCIVLKGVSIGDNAVIGAGSVVTKDVPANAVAAGNPCVVIRMLPV